MIKKSEDEMEFDVADIVNNLLNLKIGPADKSQTIIIKSASMPEKIQIGSMKELSTCNSTIKAIGASKKSAKPQ